MMRQWIFGGLALATGAGLSAQTPTTKVDTGPSFGAVDKVTQTEDVKFKNEQYDRLTVPVRVSGHGPYRFLVDTGADRTAISHQLANSLNLQPGQKASLHSVAGVSAVSTAMVPELELTRKPVKVLDAPLLDGANIGADGILGVDSLRSQRVVFNFENQTMSIVPSATLSAHSDPNEIVIQAYRKNGRLVLTDAVANGHPLTVVLDTGSQVSIGNEALRQKLMGHVVNALHDVNIQSVTGETITGQYAFVREFEIGGIQLKNLAVVFADAHTFHQLKLDKEPALLLGMNAIRAFKKVSIDFANRKFKVVLPEQSELAFRLADKRFD